jgi:hypothetical protein
MRLTPSHRLYRLGAILLMALTIGLRNFGRTSELSFVIPLAVVGVAYLLALRALIHTRISVSTGLCMSSNATFVFIH